MKKSLLFLLLLTVCLAISSRADTVVVFNEIMYHPSVGEATNEWVELRNQMAVDVDISGWSLDGGIHYTFPSNTIVRGGGFIVVTVSTNQAAATNGTTATDGFLGRLSNNGDDLKLRNNSGRVVDEVNYGTEGDWPVAPDGSGVSLAKLDRDGASGPAENWTSSEQVGGTPGADNFPFVGVTFPDVQLVAADSAWKYEASGTDLGAGWRAPNFTDAGWQSGNGWFYNGAITNGERRPLPTLFNSGIGTNGAVLAGGTLDPHYTITAAAQGPINTNAVVILNHPNWLANDSSSSWIGVANPGSGNVAAGGYTYQTRFSTTGFQPGSVNVTASVAVDNELTNVFLNGTPLGFGFAGFSAFSSAFTIPSGLLVATNTLDFRTGNYDGPGANPHGLRVLLNGSGLMTLTNTFLPAGPSTYYLRKSFVYTGNPANSILRLNAIVDDGAVFYLNGVEVYRTNMPGGVISYGTAAASNLSSPVSTGLITIPGGSLLAGTNVLAVELHQAGGDTSDILFGAELIATPVGPPPVTISFNEFSPSTNSEFWLELMNFGTNSFLLDGCVIYRDGDTNNNNEYFFPSNNVSLAPGAYLAITNATLGFHPDSGDKLYLYAPGKTRVYDAVVVKKAPRGRSPNGTGPYFLPNIPTPGAPNSFAFHNEIVINEIMYNHRGVPGTNGLPSAKSKESWLELYNRSASPVDLNGWELDGGISYKFLNKTMAAGAYLVVAKDSVYLRSVYPAVDIVGDFSKDLSGSSDTIILRDPSGNPANQVRYFDSGRWPLFAAGGGSSLELRDPNADNSKAEAWAASNEAGKTSWQTNSYRVSAAASVTANPDAQWREFVLGLLDDGECFIDDVSVVQSPGANPIQFIANGNFESGLSGWRVLGNHVRSTVEVDPDNPANHVLHVVSTGPQEHMHNHIETTLAGGRSVTNGQLYEVSFRARHLGGNNLLNTRLYFNRVARTTVLPTAVLNGTPGAQNSRYATNIGPTLSQFKHERTVPQAGEAVTVSVVAQDPQGVSACQVWWSANGGAWSNAPMNLQAGGLYTGTIPGLAASTIVQFYVRAVDGLGVASTFPAAGPNAGALYKVNDAQANLSIAHNVRIILTPANTALLHASTNVMSNDLLPCTVIYDETRAYYDMSLHLKSSERGRNDPARVGYHLVFHPDELFRGVHPVMLVDRGGGGGRPPQEEILIRHMMVRAGGIPAPHADICRVLAPQAAQTGAAIFAPRFEDEFIETAIPHGASGTFYEMELIYYPTTVNVAGYKEPQPDAVQGLDFSNVGDDKETYRYNFIIKNHRDADDYSRLISFAKSWSATSAIESQTRPFMDVDEWMRSYAMVSLCSVGDMYTFGNNHNLMSYVRPSDQKVIYLPWDMDFSFTGGSGRALIGDQNLGRIINAVPAYKRCFYAHVLDHISTCFNTSYMNYWINRYDDFSAPGTDYSADLTFIQQRITSVTAEINNNGGTAQFAVSGTNFITTGSNFVTLSGTAPPQIKTIKINGVEYPITWNSVSSWTIRLAVFAPSNSLELVGYDVHERPMTNLTRTVTVNYTGLFEDPADKIVINEIMYSPLTPGASFVELLNNSPGFAFDLSGWRLHGLDYTFPPGTILGPGAVLVLAKDAVAFGTAYGGATPLFDTFDGNLQIDGETLSLIQPGTTNVPDLLIDKVRYETAAPWPTGPNTDGYSLQLIDASQDNARVSNWADGSGWRFVSLTGNVGSTSNGVATNVLIFMAAAGEAYVDDISFAPLSGPNAGSNLLQNAGFETPVSTNFSTTNWIVATNMIGSTITNTYAHSGNYSLHVVATNAGNQNIAIRQLLPPINTNIFCTLSFWFKPLVSANLNVRTFPGSAINASVSPRPVFSTPGSNNLVVASLSPFPLLWINEIQPDNINGITDSAGQHDPWLELYNSGTNALTLDGYSLANNYTNLSQWFFPTGTVINPGEFKVIFADGQTNQATASELHTSFRLSSITGSIALSRPYGGSQQILDYINYTGLPTNHSFGSFPDGQLFDRQDFYYVTPGGTNNGTAAPLTVFINEWMASNTRTLADNSSGVPKYDDWFELYNPTTNAANLAGYFLTDNLTNKFQYEIPSGYVIPPHGYLLVWADGEPAQNGTNRTDLHVSFQLNKAGEQIGLFASDGLQIDAVTFGAQTSDVSEGRCPEGTTNIVTLPTPSPRAANNCAGNNTAPVLNPIGNKYVHQGQTLSFTATATDAEAPPQVLTFSLDSGAPAAAHITANGLFTWSTTGVPAPSTNSMTVRVTDNGTPNLDDSELVNVIVLRPLAFGQLTRTNNQLTLHWGGIL